MHSKKILALNGHPSNKSLSTALTDAYVESASLAGHQVRRHDLANMTFDADFGQSRYHQTKALEPDIETFLVDLEWADHVFITTPLWWGGLPARLKGLLDRTLLPGRAFDPSIIKAGLPKPLLLGKTSRVVITSDTPSWAFGLMYSWAARKQLDRQILKFVGIKPNRFTNFAPASQAKPATIERWIEKAGNLGLKAI